jgi:hypothetical protein
VCLRRAGVTCAAASNLASTRYARRTLTRRFHHGTPHPRRILDSPRYPREDCAAQCRHRARGAGGLHGACGGCGGHGAKPGGTAGAQAAGGCGCGAPLLGVRQLLVALAAAQRAQDVDGLAHVSHDFCAWHVDRRGGGFEAVDCKRGVEEVDGLSQFAKPMRNIYAGFEAFLLGKAHGYFAMPFAGNC